MFKSKPDFLAQPRWTRLPRPDLPILPQCGGKWDRYMTHERFWPRQRGPGVNLRFIGQGTGWSPQTLKNELRGRRIVLMGDSTMRQWYNSLACYLNANFTGWSKGGEAAESRNNQLKSVNGAQLQDGDDPTIWHFNLFTLPDIAAEIAIYVTKNPANTNLRRAIITYHTWKEKADAIIINEGSHYKEPDSLKKQLMMVAQHCRQENANCIFRETLPQHFNSRSGLYESATKRGCSPASYEEALTRKYDPRATWRNDVLYEVIAEHGNLSTMSTFDDMLFLGFAHPGDRDCTHFVPDMELWEPMHFGLIRLLRGLPQA